MNETDAQPDGVGDGADGDLLAVDEDAAGVWLVNAAKDFHQGAFARAVFADERDNLAERHIQGYVRQRDDAGEKLADPLQLKDGRWSSHCNSRRM